MVVDAHGPRWGVAAGLFLVGLGMGIWDVSMNLEGADVERHLGTSVMPHFHAAFSGGTVVSALVGAAMSRAGVPLTVHFAGAAVITVALAWWALPHFLPRSTEQPAAAPRRPQRHRSAWLEPRTLLIGVVVFAAAFTEGTANDWLAVAFVEGHDLEQWVGVLAFATFLTFMTARPDRRHRPARPLRPGAGAAGQLRPRRARRRAGHPRQPVGRLRRAPPSGVSAPRSASRSG